MVSIWHVLWQKRDHFCNLSAALLNSWTWYGKDFTFSTDIPVFMPKKKDRFYVYIIWITKSYNTLKSHKNTLTRNLFFETEASMNFSRVFCRFIYCKIIYDMFPFNY